jgi:hypothetical protein
MCWAITKVPGIFTEKHRFPYLPYVLQLLNVIFFYVIEVAGIMQRLEQILTYPNKEILRKETNYRWQR